ncbi:PASTA domain-containing protein, partial [Thermodesulfobacteriota bacterium]
GFGRPASILEETGKVVSQEPKPGSEVKAGTEVEIKVYMPYVEQRTVPDVTGLSYEDAKNRLMRKGFKVRKIELGNPSNSKQALIVRSQDPKPGAMLRSGGTITLEKYGNYVPVKPKCSEYYSGSISVWDAKKNRYVCGCPKGQNWNKEKTKCVSNNDICKRDYPGSIATGIGSSGKIKCDCPKGYKWNRDNTKCVATGISRNRKCQSEYPGSISVWDAKHKRYACGCPKGQQWNRDKTKCVATGISRNRECQRAYPGSISVWESKNNRYACDCPKGKQWSRDKTKCISTTVIPPPGEPPGDEDDEDCPCVDENGRRYRVTMGGDCGMEGSLSIYTRDYDCGRRW